MANAAAWTPQGRLPLLACAWALLGLGLALAAPWLGLAPAWLQGGLNLAAPLTTAGLIAWCLVAAVRRVGATGRTLTALPLALAQLVLFALLFFQIACHQGAEHYEWDRLPRWWDWLGFAAAHGLRAADLVDGIEAYGLHIQTIRHAGQLTSLTLIVFHLVMNLFVISLLVEWLDRARALLLASPRRAQAVRRLARRGLALFVAFWLASVWLIRPWRATDVMLWPVDNLLRCVDFVDAMEIYHVRLHGVPRVWYEGTLTLICRAGMSLLLAGALGWAGREVSLRWLSGFGLRPDDLEEVRSGHRDPAVRRKASARLARIKDAVGRGPALTRAAVVRVALAAGVLAGVLVGVAAAGARWDEAAGRLARAAVDPDDPAADRALAALRRMGPYAERAVPVLGQSLPGQPQGWRRAMLETLGYLGPAANEPLRQVAREGDEETALAAVQASRPLGPRGLPTLSLAMTSPHPSVRQAARQAIRELGTRAVQGLIDNLTPADVTWQVGLVQELDPYWYRRSSDNPYFRQMAGVRQAVLTLQDSRSTPEQVSDAIAKLRRHGGPGAAAAVPALVELLDSPQGHIKAEAFRALGDIGPGAAQALIPMLERTPGGKPQQDEVPTILAKIDPDWRTAAVRRGLLSRLEHDDPDARERAARAVAWVGPEARQAVPVLARLLDSRQLTVARAAAEALGKIGPAAADAIPVLKKVVKRDPRDVGRVASEALDRIDKDWRKRPD